MALTPIYPELEEAMQALGYAKAVKDMLVFIVDFNSCHGRLPGLADMMEMLRTMNGGPK